MAEIPTKAERREIARKRSSAWRAKNCKPVAGRKPGRPPSEHPTERIHCAVSRVTACKINRLAKAWGFIKTKGGKSYLGSVIDRICEGIETEEPEYLKLARAANVLKH